MQRERFDSVRLALGAGFWCRFALALTLLASLPAAAEAPADQKDSCVDCHRNPDFLVQNKKLYDYYRDWQLSIHRQQDVTCSDCHGGNPEFSDKARAHGGEVGEEGRNNAVNFRNIPDTCGQCHDEFLEAYLGSKHFKHLVKAKQEKQGPRPETTPRSPTRPGSS
jgi:Cytochrome c554 and c-prime